MNQLSLYQQTSKLDYRQKLIDLLSRDLDFHDQESKYATHDIHAFPAKFPPQLPKKFIIELTIPGEVVLDPMAGSGTTVLEAILADRCGIGFDIDPLALKISKSKIIPLDLFEVYTLEKKIVNNARIEVMENYIKFEEALQSLGDIETNKFINHWFAPETQVELLILAKEIEKINNQPIRNFFEVVLSSIIITKSGGVSLALDLAHTRPHRAKLVFKKNGDLLFENGKDNASSSRINILKKTLRSAIDEFQKRIKQNLKSLSRIDFNGYGNKLLMADAQKLPLKSNTVGLIVTSPPYASNAIDYMRAHKFSLVWLGYPIYNLGKIRKKYIGGEVIQDIHLEELPSNINLIIKEITRLDKKKGMVLFKYYSEIKRALKEMYRVLKPGKAAIVVVGSSTMRGVDTEIHLCLSEIGKSIGFEVPKIGLRKLDRNRRMLPAGTNLNLKSQIQQRMHHEYVIGFYKPLD